MLQHLSLLVELLADTLSSIIQLPPTSMWHICLADIINTTYAGKEDVCCLKFQGKDLSLAACTAQASIPAHTLQPRRQKQQCAAWCTQAMLSSAELLHSRTHASTLQCHSSSQSDSEHLCEPT